MIKQFINKIYSAWNKDLDPEIISGTENLLTKYIFKKFPNSKISQQLKTTDPIQHFLYVPDGINCLIELESKLTKPPFDKDFVDKAISKAQNFFENNINVC